MAQVSRRTKCAGEFRYDVRTRIGGRVVTKSFRRRKDADAYATTIEADRLRGVAIDPRRAKVSLRTFADRDIAGRAHLAERTVAKYRWLLDDHILPTLGEMALSSITPTDVREWHANLAMQKPTTAAGAYRLLSSIMRAAVADEILYRNPCQVKGASTETAPPRPIASVSEVQALTGAMPDELRLAVQLATWCQLRRSEILGLRRMDVDLLHGSITVAVTRGPSMRGREVVKEPKTKAGRRTLAIPPNIAEALEEHLAAFTGPDRDAWVIDVSARTLERAWDDARATIERPDLRLHDLRHTGLTLAAATGATIAELMHRAGHASPAAAIRYQHATEDRDRVLARALADLDRHAAVVDLGARDARAMDRSEPSGLCEPEEGKEQLSGQLNEQSQRGSNPCLHLERVVS